VNILAHRPQFSMGFFIFLDGSYYPFSVCLIMASAGCLRGEFVSDARLKRTKDVLVWWSWGWLGRFGKVWHGAPACGSVRCKVRVRQREVHIAMAT
jgi:hypothetical protein